MRKPFDTGLPVAAATSTVSNGFKFRRSIADILAGISQRDHLLKHDQLARAIARHRFGPSIEVSRISYSFPALRDSDDVC
jgi:hypothetical protein